MARAIKKGGPLKKPDTFSPSPKLRIDATSVYQRCYPDRFKLFGNGTERPTRVADETVLPLFRHELLHDAESSVWVFLWWIVLAAPQGKELVYIDETVWKYFSSEAPKDIHRQKLLYMLQNDLFRSDFVHPEYQQLLPLITSMAALIETDYYWVKEDKYKHPEYLHDALQRVILNFLLENKDASFMDLRKSPEPRQVEPVVLAVPPIYVEPRVPAFVSPSSNGGKKRKASGSSVHDSQPQSSISSSREPRCGSFTVRFVP